MELNNVNFKAILITQSRCVSICTNHIIAWNVFDVVNEIILKNSPRICNFSLICSFPLMSPAATLALLVGPSATVSQQASKVILLLTSTYKPFSNSSRINKIKFDLIKICYSVSCWYKLWILISLCAFRAYKLRLTRNHIFSFVKFGM